MLAKAVVVPRRARPRALRGENMARRRWLKEVARSLMMAEKYSFF
jgi:hypothetical protein